MSSRQVPVAIRNVARVHSEYRGGDGRALRIRKDFPASHGERSLDLILHLAVSTKVIVDIPRESGVAVAISKGLIETLQRGQPVPICDCGPDAAARELSRRLNLRGPHGAAVAACASGLACVKLGMDWLRDGVCPAVLAGAAESSQSEMVLSSFERLGVISPSRQTRPFDAKRDGFVVGEGAALFLLEDYERASRETIEPPAAVLGLALGSDAHHLTAPDTSGKMLAHVIELALMRAGLDPRQIGWVHAHGTGTEYNDRVEIVALRQVFGKKIPPVTATKGTTGHLLGASGALALSLTLSALEKREVPCIAGLEEPDREFAGIDFVMHAARRSDAAIALVLNHGFGGHIAAAVIGRVIVT